MARRNGALAENARPPRNGALERPPRDNLFRLNAVLGVELREEARAVDGSLGVLAGHFAVFNQWTEINSWFEGNFLERIAPTAFDETFRARAGQIRVLYDHGSDPQIGNKPLGTPDVLRADKTGAYYEVGLFDATYVNDLKPAIRTGQLGASFRFRVTSEEWVTPSEPSDWNPAKLDERTVTGVELYEFGPVTFPAYPDASAGLRSRTDEFLEHFLNDPLFVARFKERVGPAVVDQIRAGLPPTVDPAKPEAPTALEASPGEAPTEPVDTYNVTVNADMGVDGKDIGRQVVEHIKALEPATTADGGDVDAPQERANWVERHILNPPERPIVPPVQLDEADKAEVESRRRWVSEHVRHIA